MTTKKVVKVPKTGFEPARRFQRYHLKVVRLPISPPGPEGRQIYKIKHCDLELTPFIFYPQ